jgi:hypothetical protein
MSALRLLAILMGLFLTPAWAQEAPPKELHFGFYGGVHYTGYSALLADGERPRAQGLFPWGGVAVTYLQSTFPIAVRGYFDFVPFESNLHPAGDSNISLIGLSLGATVSANASWLGLRHAVGFGPMITYYARAQTTGSGNFQLRDPDAGIQFEMRNMLPFNEEKNRYVSLITRFAIPMASGPLRPLYVMFAVGMEI